MGLRDLNLKSVYRSENDNLLKDFYIPALSQAVRYDRAVGFFSSGLLTYAAKGLSAFLTNKGKMRLIIGKELLPEELEAVMTGSELKAALENKENTEKLIESLVLQLNFFERGTLPFDRVAILRELITTGALEIKIALKAPGMFHEKIGIIYDQLGDYIVFQGSANETPSAMLPVYNQESINVFKSWIPEHEMLFEPHVTYFDQLWSGRSKETLVVDLPQAVTDAIIEKFSGAKLLSKEAELARAEQEFVAKIQKAELHLPIIPPDFKLKRHQRDALQKWQVDGYRGILEMCTGAGKTMTSIYGAIKVFECDRKMLLIITVPYIALADQWCEVLNSFNIFPTKCWDSKSTWEDELKEKIGRFKKGHLKFHAVVVTNKTLQSDEFKSFLLKCSTTYKLGENMFWVGDECHNHATSNTQELLRPEIKYVLGLSATVGTSEYSTPDMPLGEFYGKIVAKYGLDDALREGVLTPYRYYLECVTFEDEEAEKYIELTEKISKLMASESLSLEGKRQLEFLMFQRARLVGVAKNKFLKLREILVNRKLDRYLLVYCGDGQVEDDDLFDEVESKNGVGISTKILSDLNYRVSKYTYEEKPSLRKEILKNFADGNIHALTAVRCLDEGLDIPAIKYAFLLASSRNPRQFVQRRGRVLRRYPGKAFAEIFDFYVKLPEKFASYRALERNIVKGDLSRIYEFARYAQNSADATKIVEQLSQEYGVFDFYHT